MSDSATFREDLEFLRTSRAGRRMERRVVGAALVLVVVILSLAGLWSDEMARRVESLVPVVGSMLLPFLAGLVGISQVNSSRENLAQIKGGQPKGAEHG